MQTMQQRLKALSSDIHAMSHRLHPAKLKHLGLVAAIRALCRDMEEGGLHVQFTERDILRMLPDNVALTLYRVAQEGLQNVRKHSGTDSVELTLTRQSTFVTLRLRDKGKGFDPSRLECSDGLGLVSMTERVGSVGGTLAIRSAPGAGTEIEACVPIQPESPME
jgi:signal transduction histidine kinase